MKRAGVRYMSYYSSITSVVATLRSTQYRHIDRSLGSVSPVNICALYESFESDFVPKEI